MCSVKLIPPEFRPGALQAAEQIRNRDRFLLACHVNPDGDAIGSIFACAHILKALGKEFALYLPQDVPHALDFLPIPGPVCRSLAQLPFVPQTAIYLDCSDAHRLGNELGAQAHKWPTINIDHHICEAGLGSEVNFIFTEAAATCQLVAYVALVLDLPLAGALGEAIGTGLLTDTGHFSHGNTNAAVFDLAATLERDGIRMAILGELLHNSMSVNRLKLFGTLFCQVHIDCGGKLAWCVVHLADLQQMGCSGPDLEGFVEWLRKIRGVEIAMLVREQHDGQCKFSLRSRGATDVQCIATQLGGGGHKNASGGTLDGGTHAAIDRLLHLIRNYFLRNSTCAVPLSK